MERTLLITDRISRARLLAIPANNVIILPFQIQPLIFFYFRIRQGVMSQRSSLG